MSKQLKKKLVQHFFSSNMSVFGFLDGLFYFQLARAELHSLKAMFE